MQNDIFESPDNGKTVYARQPRSLKRRLVDHVVDEESLNDQIEKAKVFELWSRILWKSTSDPDLKEMTDKIKSWYLLKYSS